MLVLHVKFTNIAKAPDYLVDCLNKYSKDKNVYRLLVLKKDMCPKCINKKIIDIANKVNHKDVIIHFHNIAKKVELPKKYKLVKTFIQYHSEPWNVDLRTKVSKKLVISQYHMCLPEYNKFRVVKNIIDYNISQYRYVVPNHNKMHVTFSPSVLVAKSIYADKGYAETKPILDRLKNKGLLTHDIMHGVPRHEMLRRKANSHVVIDECKTGSFHRSGLEGLALGKIVICKISPQLEKKLKTILKCDKLPFINCGVNQLENTLVDLSKKSTADLVEMGKRNKEWFVKYWKVQDVVNDFVSLYKI